MLAKLLAVVLVYLTYLHFCASFVQIKCATAPIQFRLFDSETYRNEGLSELQQPAVKAVWKTDPRSINKAIVETFSSSASSKADVERLRSYLKENLTQMNQINVITLMHRCGKHKLDLFSFIDMESTVKLLDVKESGVATAQGIANAVYSLQSMTSNSVGSLHLINVLSEQLMASKEVFDGQAISNTLYGLKGMSTDTSEVRGMLRSVHKTIERCLLIQTQGKVEQIVEKKNTFGHDNDRFKSRDFGPMSSSSTFASGLRMTPQGIGSAFIGLQGMSSSNNDVKSILSVLAHSIIQMTASNTGLDCQAIANVLVGLRSSSSEHIEVREVLVALSKNLKRNLAVFRDIKPRELSMALQGLQGMSSEHPQVEQLLEVLCDGLDLRILDGKGQASKNNCGFEFRSGDEVGPALGGLKQMSAENVQVRRLLQHIGRAMRASGGSTGTLSQSKATDSAQKNGTAHSKKEARAHSADNSSTQPHRSLLHMNEQNIANSLYGLQSMDCRTREVRTILAVLAGEITGCDGRLSGRTIANSLYGLQCMTATTTEVKAVLRALTRKLDKDATDYTGQHIAMSLYGLQWMSGSSKEMESLITTLAERIEASPLHLSGTHIASAVYGMQSMSSNFPYVRRLLKALADKMPLKDSISISSSDTTTATHGAGAVLSSTTTNIRVPIPTAEIIEANKCVELCLSGQETAMMMHGLRCMGSEWAQVQDMLSSVTYRMRISSTAETTAENMIYALQEHPVGSDTGSSKNTEPGPEIGGTVVQRVKAAVGISRSAVMTAKELSRALNGLQNMGGGRIATPSPLQQQSINLLGGPSINILPWVDVDGAAVVGSKKRQRVPIPLLQLLTALADRLEARAERLSGPMVATAVYGLQGLSADIPPVRRIVRILAADLEKSTIPLDSRNMGNIMYGMQKMTMTSRNRQVRELLSSISKAFKMTPYPLSAQAVGNCFYGLQGMSSEIPEVRQVLRALAAKVNEMPLAPSLGTRYTEENQIPSLDHEDRHMNREHLDIDDEEHSRFKSSVVEYMLSGQNIGNALWGLRNTTSEHEEVREALAALSVKISQSNAELNGQNIGNALYSLHSMDGEAAEVRAVLGCLAHKIVVSKQPLSGLDIGMSLFGLRSMNAEIPEVRVILAALIVKIRNSDCQLKLRDLSMAIIGVLNATPWIRDDFLKVLASKTPGMSPYVNDDPDSNEREDGIKFENEYY